MGEVNGIQVKWIQNDSGASRTVADSRLVAPAVIEETTLSASLEMKEDNIHWTYSGDKSLQNNRYGNRKDYK